MMQANDVTAKKIGPATKNGAPVRNGSPAVVVSLKSDSKPQFDRPCEFVLASLMVLDMVII